MGCVLNFSYDTKTSELYNQPRNAAVQIAAAITAHARIHMHPYFSGGDCFYTDTDSVVLSQKLPDEIVSSWELGKLKLEYTIKEGIFNPPKSSCLMLHDDKPDIMVHQGAAKQHVTREWYIEQYNERLLVQKKVRVTNPFSVSMKSITFKEKSSDYLPVSATRF